MRTRLLNKLISLYYRSGVPQERWPECIKTQYSEDSLQLLPYAHVNDPSVCP